MKITDIKHEYFRWPRSVPLTNGILTYTHCGLSVVTIRTDEGMATRTPGLFAAGDVRTKRLRQVITAAADGAIAATSAYEYVSNKI